MGKLDELLNGVHVPGQDHWPLADAARAELAALRQRAEDAELLFRVLFDNRLFLCKVTQPLHRSEYASTWTIREPIKVGDDWEYRDVCEPLAHDHRTGLPVLTEEARNALKSTNPASSDAS